MVPTCWSKISGGGSRSIPTKELLTPSNVEQSVFVQMKTRLCFGCVPRAVYWAMMGKGREDYSLLWGGVGEVIIHVRVRKGGGGWEAWLAPIKRIHVYGIFTSKCYNCHRISASTG